MRNIYEMFDSFEDDAELPKIDVEFDSDRINDLVLSKIHTTHKRRSVRLMRSILIAAAIMCLMVTTALKDTPFL